MARRLDYEIAAIVAGGLAGFELSYLFGLAQYAEILALIGAIIGLILSMFYTLR